MAGGFRPTQDISGNDYVGKVQTYYVESSHATLLAIGDLVVETGNTDSNGIATVDAASAGGLITGAIVAVNYNPSNLEQAGLPASTAGYVEVAVDPNTIFEAYVNASGITAADVGANADIVATAATLTGGLAYSNMVINGASYASGTAQIRIVGLVDGATGAGAKVYCRINESTVKGVVGV
jgi:hypothetical protein